MTNRIVNFEVRVHRLTPTEAELWVIVAAERTTPETEIRGRFVGPKCVLSSTIEVAYPLRAFPRQLVQLPQTCARVVIPEPSLWEPECPFVYDGVVELWQDGKCADVTKAPGFKLLMKDRTEFGNRQATQ